MFCLNFKHVLRSLCILAILVMLLMQCHHLSLLFYCAIMSKFIVYTPRQKVHKKAYYVRGLSLLCTVLQSLIGGYNYYP